MIRVRAVRAILMNPRYTGRQVWNRQRKDEVLIDVHDTGWCRRIARMHRVAGVVTCRA
jgi:recombinase